MKPVHLDSEVAEMIFGYTKMVRNSILSVCHLPGVTWDLYFLKRRS